MITKIQKWGNSLAMRLPKELASSFNLKAGSQVTFITNNDGFTIRPEIKIEIPKYTLEDMVKGITKKNRHKEFDWGKPMGKEIW
jgi:antitoxin MazE